MLKLLRTANQVIELLNLPELPLHRESAIDLCARKSLPRRTLRKERVLIAKRRQNVDMVWHHHGIGEQIPLVVEMQQRIKNDL
jgi:hypothetical protein